MLDFLHCKIMQYDMRALTPSATLLAHFSTVYLAAVAWPEAFENKVLRL